jgi:hypothetical protein
MSRARRCIALTLWLVLSCAGGQSGDPGLGGQGTGGASGAGGGGAGNVGPETGGGGSGGNGAQNGSGAVGNAQNGSGGGGNGAQNGSGGGVIVGGTGGAPDTGGQGGTGSNGTGLPHCSDATGTCEIAGIHGWTCRCAGRPDPIDEQMSVCLDALNHACSPQCDATIATGHAHCQIDRASDSGPYGFRCTCTPPVDGGDAGRAGFNAGPTCAAALAAACP